MKEKPVIWAVLKTGTLQLYPLRGLPSMASKYTHLPDHIVSNMQAAETLEQASLRNRGSLCQNRGNP
jgi:hypothetical protein